jgi:hypothetical protein
MARRANALLRFSCRKTYLSTALNKKNALLALN